MISQNAYERLGFEDAVHPQHQAPGNEHLAPASQAIKAAWKVVHDGDSLGMLQAPDGRMFRIQQLGAGLVEGWGNAADNDAICAMLAQSPAAPERSSSGGRAAVSA